MVLGLRQGFYFFHHHSRCAGLPFSWSLVKLRTSEGLQYFFFGETHVVAVQGALQAYCALYSLAEVTSC
jgi:UDP-N-acetyl-D-mannosaminuronic acid transferase (WecB/TagA/CpsF family)